ncbi:MAG: YfhO family protein [Acidimicrobiales bacterium]
MTKTDSRGRGVGRRRRWFELLALIWLLLSALAMLAPALLHGPYLGPYQLLGRTGLLHQPGAAIANSGNSDLITEMIPWTALTWTQVHHLQLPLWNPFSGFGMPLAFNWQSAPFGLPALVGYLFPMRYAFTIGVIVTLMVAGTGAYVLARVLGLSVLAGVMAGTFFELSGPFLGWLGYPLGAVFSWTGWLLAAGTLVLRGRRRARDIAFFAVTLAMAVYAGNPEGLAVVVFAVSVFLVVVLATLAWRHGVGTLVAPIISLMIATVAGVALAAPLALPGYQLATKTARVSLGGHSSLPLRTITGIVLPNDYLAYSNSAIRVFYEHVPSTIGFIAVPLALAGLVVCWRKAEVRAFLILIVLFVALLFSSSVETVVDHLPFMSRVYWSRGLVPMALGLSTLAGFGADALIRRGGRRRTVLWIGVGFLGLALWLLDAWISRRQHLTASLTAAQNRAFLWPFVDVASGLIIVVALLLVNRVVLTSRRASASRMEASIAIEVSPSLTQRRWRWRWAASMTVFLIIQTASLATIGASSWQSGSTFLPTTDGVTTLQHVIANGLVAAGSGGCTFGSQFVGISLETNVGYSVHEAGIYDPIIPLSYFRAWRSATGQSGGVPALASFCPEVTTAVTGRRFGIEYVLTAPGTVGPKGSLFVTTLGSGRSIEDLYRIPGAAPATLAPLLANGVLPSSSVAGRPVALYQPNPSTWRLKTVSTVPSVLRLHLTDVPGWRATIDGRPLALDQFSGVMLQALLPAGHHTVVVTYWPKAFSLGIVLAVVAAVVLATALIVSEVTSRRRYRSSRSEPLKRG